ncbi:15495_t:CDS:2 [Entrophospora sp. SA101]|nr:2000_t:CDS:2 [Entrophospora sp. SA101]CAJ0750713.1 1273_t:CDS:2 [Entrophospora sp. SA101]CAJ0769312.1 15495_t:CDS:2 [Entrophospora sp. SA101]
MMLRNKRRRDKKEDDEDNDEEDNDKEEEDDKDEVEEDKDEEDKDDKVEDGAWKNKYVAMDPVSVVNVIDLFVAVGFAAEKNCIGLEYLDINI